MESLSFDPHRESNHVETQINTALFEGLVSHHPVTVEPVPAVAKSWQISEDRLRITMFIRTKAWFDTGEAVLAEDFQESWRRLLSPSTDSPYAYLLDSVVGAYEYRMGQAKSFEDVGVRVLAPRVLEISFERPDATFLDKLTHHSLAPLHASLRDKLPAASPSRVSIVGNGPYTIARDNGTSLELEENPVYWDAEAVSIERIVLRTSLGDGETSRGYNTGQIEWILGSEFSVPTLSDIGSARFAERFETAFLRFDTSREPWNDSRVRRGLMLLLSLNVLRNHRTHSPAIESLVPSVPGYAKIRAAGEARRREAYRLFEQAGYPEGTDLPQIRIRLPEDREGDRLFNVLSATWTTSLNIGASGVARSKEDDAEISLATVSGDYADPEAILRRLVDRHSSQIELSGDPVDPLATEMYKTLAHSGHMPRSERFDALALVERQLLELATFIPLFQTTTVHVIDTERITGWHTNLLDIHPFKYLSFGPPRIAPGIALIDRRAAVSTQTAR